MLSMKGKRELVSSLRVRLHRDFGEIDHVSYEFRKHGVFFHKGTGRGYVIESGRLIRGTRDGALIKPLQTQQGPLQRRPKNWYNPTMNREVPKIADQIAELIADSATEKIIKIK